ncbi:MAG: hypothetical protein JSU86_13935 [Phycisphaerales bacterium]|nr:MAG: hypothetical protein JSU86_13935 [Phycisphaerales bacterium]
MRHEGVLGKAAITAISLRVSGGATGRRSLYGWFRLLALALAVATSTSCVAGGVGHATANPTTEPVKWGMLQHPDIPKGTPIPTGPSLIKVVNPVRDTVLVIFSSNGYAGSFFVEHGEASQYSVSNGRYQMFFIYSDEPEALYQGDDVTVWNQISIITLQLVPDGNYNIRRIR